MSINILFSKIINERKKSLSDFIIETFLKNEYSNALKIKRKEIVWVIICKMQI